MADLKIKPKTSAGVSEEISMSITTKAPTKPLKSDKVDTKDTSDTVKDKPAPAAKPKAEPAKSVKVEPFRDQNPSNWVRTNKNGMTEAYNTNSGEKFSGKSEEFMAKLRA